MMRALLIFLLLTGCTTAKPVRTGDPAQPPAGYIDLCTRMPTAPECRGR